MGHRPLCICQNPSNLLVTVGQADSDRPLLAKNGMQKVVLPKILAIVMAFFLSTKLQILAEESQVTPRAKQFEMVQYFKIATILEVLSINVLEIEIEYLWDYS